MSKAISAALLAALVLEASARLVFHYRVTPYPERVDHDLAWRAAWAVRDPLLSQATYPLDEFHPTRGWASRPDYEGEDLSTNAKGLRGMREYAYERRPGVRRVAYLGDSFVFGEEVGDQESFPAVLQKLDAKGEHLNFGVHGYGHDQMLLYLREEVVKYAPDLIVVGFVDGDMSRNLLSFRDAAKPKMEVRDGRLGLVGGPVPSPEESRRRERFRSRFLDLLVLAAFVARRPPSDGVTAAILDAMAKEGKVLLVHLPDRPEPGGPFLANYCAARRADCLDLTGLGKDLRFLDGGHWDAEGHRRIAEAIRERLK